MPAAASIEESQTGLDPLSTRRAWRLNILAGVGGVTFFAGTTGAVLNGFALALGADDFHIGLMGAIPLVAFSAQVLGAWAVESFRWRKRYWSILTSASRLLWVPILLVPFVLKDTPASVQLGAFLVLMLMSSMLGAAGTPAWFSWMADVVPEKQAGRFWGRRTAVLQIVAAVVSIPIALFLDLFAQSTVAGFGFVFGVAVLFGEIDVMIHRWIAHPQMPRAPAKRTNPIRLIMQPLQDKGFRRFLLLTCLWNFAVNLFVPFMSVYFLRDLKMAYLHIALLSICFSFSVSLFSRFWGYIIDHFGKRPVIVVLLVLKFMVPGAYLFTHEGLIYPILVPIFIFDGFMMAGLQLAVQAALLSYSPRERRSMFIATYNALIGVVSAIAPVMMGAAISALPQFRLDWGPFHWTSIHLAFLCSAVMRIFVWPLGFLLTESGSGSPMHIVRAFLETNPFRVIHHLYVLTESSDLGRRKRSARALEHNPGPMAVAHLIEAMHDPNREVRASAALALGRVNQPAAVQALIQALHSCELDIQQEAATALGVLGTAAGVEALVEALRQSPDATLRGHVARVLGQTNATQAAPPLLSLFRTPQSSSVLASAAESLSNLGEVRALRAILPQMRRTGESVARTQMAVAAANLLGAEGEFYTILSDEKHTPGLSVARLAAALGDDLRALRLDGPSNRLKSLSLSFLQGDYSEACRHCRKIGQGLFGLGQANGGDPQVVAFIDQIRLLLLAEPKLGIQMWFVLVMGSEEWAQQAPVSMEMALLAHYALVKATATLRKNPELRGLGA